MSEPKLEEENQISPSASPDEKHLGTVDVVQSVNTAKQIANDKEIRDKAYTLLKGRIEEVVDPKASKRVLRKLDWIILPLVFLVYGFNTVDKSSLSWAVLMDFKTDLGITGDQYSWVSSVFYFGYLGAEYPANLIVHKYPVARVIGCVCLSWGILMLAHIGATNYAGILVIRFLLGVAEAPISAACITYIGNWYTKEEQPFRFLVFASGQGILYLLFTLVAYGLAFTDGTLKSWKYIYLLLGLVTLLLGSVFLLLVPSLPSDARFLNEEEKVIAAQRVATNMKGIKTTQWQNYQVWHAIKDPKTWLLILYMLFSMIPNGGLTNFNTLVLESFDFDKYETLLVNLPWSLFSSGQMWVWAIAGLYFKNMRIAGLIIPMIIAIIGISIVYSTEDSKNVNKWGRVFAYWMINSCSAAWPWLMNLTGQLIGGHTKQSFTNAVVLVIFAVGNIAGPFAFKDSDAPKYTHALSTIIGCFAACIVVGCMLGVYIWYENKRRDALYGNPEMDEELKLQGVIDGLKDKTDLENHNFRFVY